MHVVCNQLSSFHWLVNNKGHWGSHIQIRDVVCMPATMVSNGYWGSRMLHIGCSKLVGG
jgi:hypothetical protein